MKIISRTVLLLSFVSLFADVASEMLYPVIPVYLKDIGFSVLLIGLLEGVANFTAALSKGYFGKRSDESGLRLPFVKLGYFFSAVSKPMLAAFTFPLWIFFSRTVDRLGKGVRTAARDALLSQAATPQTKARVFGFHRSMDTLGAAIGPAVTLLLLILYPKNYALIFLLAGIPGLLSVALVFALKEKRQPSSTLAESGFFSFFGYWRIASPEYKKLVAGLVLLSLVNSSDVFLLLKTKEIVGDDRLVLGAYIFYNVVFALVSYPLGVLADRTNIRNVFLVGILFFSLVYFLFAIARSITVIFVAFFLYGIYAAAVEGLAKAWITNLSHNRNTATAVGFFTSCESICTLLASVLAGLLWQRFGSGPAFYTTAAVALLVVFYFLFGLRRPTK